MGTGMGWLSGFGNVLGGLGSLASLFVDYPNAQQAAEDTNASQQSAIDRAAGQAQDARDAMHMDVEPLRAQVGNFQKAGADQQSNISNWYNDYWSRGGLTGQAQSQADSAFARQNQAWQDSGMQNVQDATQAELANMGNVRAGFAGDRAAAYDTLHGLQGSQEQVGKNFQEQLDRKTSALGEREAALKGDMGASEILGVNSTAREQLTDIDGQIQQLQNRLGPNDPRVMDLKAQREQITQSMADKTQQVISNNQKLWLEASASFENDITNTLKGMGDSLSTLGTAQASILNTITNSRVGEANYVNDTINNAMNVGKTRFDAVNQLNSQVTDMMWNAMVNDENQRRAGLVDLPNAVIANTATNVANAESNVYAAIQQGYARVDQYMGAQIDMEYNRSPAVAYLGQFFGQGLGMISQSFGMTNAYRQFGLAQHAQTQNEALGWASTGVGAVNAFDPNIQFGKNGQISSFGFGGS